MHAEVAHNILGVDKDIEKMRDWRALIAADIGNTGLQERLGDRENALAAKGFAAAEPQRLHFFFERAFHGCLLRGPHRLCEGKYSARIGKAIRIMSRMMSVMMKGMTPLKIVAKLTSWTTLLITNTFMPTGG